MSRARRTKKAEKARAATQELGDRLGEVRVKASAAALAFSQLACAFQHVATALENLRREGLQVSGVCSSCGCSEFAACPVGCSWVDAARTKCSACFPTEELDRELGRAAAADDKAAARRRRRKS